MITICLLAILIILNVRGQEEGRVRKVNFNVRWTCISISALESLFMYGTCCLCLLRVYLSLHLNPCLCLVCVFVFVFLLFLLLMLKENILLLIMILGFFHLQAPFLSLNLHFLAEQLEKANLAERLFIEPDLLADDQVLLFSYYMSFYMFLVGYSQMFTRLPSVVKKSKRRKMKVYNFSFIASTKMIVGNFKVPEYLKILFVLQGYKKRNFLMWKECVTCSKKAWFLCSASGNSLWGYIISYCKGFSKLSIFWFVSVYLSYSC